METLASRTAPRPRSPRRPLRWLLVAVLANYAAQIPYDLHLYGLHVELRALALLGGTLLWFLAGYRLLMRRSRAGYWLIVAYLAVQVAFYFHNDVVLAWFGYGLPYHLTHARDALIWAVFFIGDVNFGAAAFGLGYLLAKRSPILTAP